MWLLLPPTIAYGVAHYVIANLSAQVSSHVMIFYKRFKEEKTGAVSRPGTDLAGDANREQVSKLIKTIGKLFLIEGEITIYRILNKKRCFFRCQLLLGL